ncbi:MULTISPECIES: winged helix-turn-helix domain-containing protein [unclassified Archaeoglobus]|jgi:predicted ArsR family transcriptional regulator|uniref:winged helix-turn-helix domain-containing protein n=1 Tax=unclassified Archaeoglobus TaxID=2643606 RepID=UPI0025C17BA6|nr:MULTISPECIES: ArsR family transcriptional regulator [unclassified Archaeoglobus]
MGDVTQAVKKRLSIGILRRNEIIRLIERGINTAYSIAKAMDLDPGTVKHHLDWLEEKGLVKSEIVVEKGRAKRIFRLTFPARILERVMEILDLVDVDIRGAEKEIARLVLEVVEGLEEDEISFDEADRIFTALLALKTVELSEEIEEMLTLANELHDGNWETVAMLKNLAREVVTNV